MAVNTNDMNAFEIDFTGEGMVINGELTAFPIAIATLNDWLGMPDVSGSNDAERRYVWKNTGVDGFSSDDMEIFELRIQINDKKYPEDNFNGSIKIEGTDYQDYVTITKEDYIYKSYIVGDLEVEIRFETGEPKEICEITVLKAEKKAPPKKKSDMYKIEKSKGDKIEFSDFNFKLLVIEELMYNQKLLKPEFDVYEFAELYDKREIDMEEEGYEPIPEVVDYFRNLEIDRKFADKITRLYQDGGNNVYMNIIPFWDGEDDVFDIASYDDVKHFPNLKNMVLFCNDQRVFDELRAKGIDAEPL